MPACRTALAILLSALVISGCSSSTTGASHSRRHGPKVNVLNFSTNPAAYKGKSITLALKVDEAFNPSQSLRDCAGREVQFTASAPRGQQIKLAIAVPPGLSMPEAGQGDEVFVTFVCKLGELHKGNEATLIELP